MSDVLRTKKDAPAASLAGGGTLPGNGVGGVLLERLALTLHELQDDAGAPLEGAALRSAAEEFAAERGFEVAEIPEDKVAKLPELAGGFPDRPAAVEVAQADPFAQLSPTATGPPPPVRPGVLPENYDDLNAADAAQVVAALEGDDRDAAVAYEQATKDRTTVLRAAEAQPA